MGTDVTGEPGRLDAVLARLTGIPRADVQRAIADGRVTGGRRGPAEVAPPERGRADRGGPVRSGSARARARRGGDPPRGRPLAGDLEARGAGRPSGPGPAHGHPRQPAARHGRRPVRGDGPRPARDRPSPRRRDLRGDGRGERRRVACRASRPVHAPRRGPAVPDPGPGPGRGGDLRDRRAAQPAGWPHRDRRGRGGRGPDRAHRPRAAPALDPARGPPPHRAHPPDPGAPQSRSVTPCSATVSTGAGETTRRAWASSGRSSTRC